MNEENTEKLRKTFRKLYPEFHPSNAMRNAPFYFECRDGWFQLIWNLSEKLEAEITNLEAKYASDNDVKMPQARQVKEKFGGLRFYMVPTTETIEKMIKEAMKISEITCEVCGEPGELRGDRWMYTLCEQHKDKKGSN